MRIAAPILVVLSMAAPAIAQENLTRVWTDQGWPDFRSAMPQTWYGISQGSRLIRLDWFLALSAGDAPFAGRALATDYGYPYMSAEAVLPIGFVTHRDENDTAWLGLNCSACHTSRLTFEETELMIHGGQSFGDFRSLLSDLTAAVADAEANPQAFLAQLPANSYSDIDALQAELTEWLGRRGNIDRILHDLDSDQDWGFGRADAVAYIQAATASVVQSEPAEFVTPANAPVNYPPAWNANQQGALQHNGLVDNGVDISVLDENVKLGAYIRNWTEALGVFAAAEMDADGTLRTSISGPNLLEIEKSLATLQSPVWPAEILGAIDAGRAARGAELYEENCVACHGIVADSADLTQLYPLDPQTCSIEGSSFGAQPFVCVQPVVDLTVTGPAISAGMQPSAALSGTDPMMTCNIMLHRIATGKLEGQLMKNTFTSVSAFARFGEAAFTNQIMAALIIKDLGNQLPELLEAQLKSEGRILIDIVKTWFGIDGQTDGGLRGDTRDHSDMDALLADCAQGALLMNGLNPDDFPLPGYKSRPLNGIWATPPYLHNGSVPSLYDLLLPPEDRPASFVVPMGAFDPVNVGLAQDQGGFEFRVYDDEGQAIVGNSNRGHVYGRDLTSADRYALVEYLKGL